MYLYIYICKGLADFTLKLHAFPCKYVIPRSIRITNLKVKETELAI